MNKCESFFSKKISSSVGRVVDVTFEMIEISSLERSPKYQRKLSSRQVERMLERPFNPLAAGYLVVNERANGKRILIDGNHRSGQMDACRELEWMCLVAHGLTEKEEANVWIDCNRHRTAIKPEDAFRGSLVAQDPLTKEIAKKVWDSGFSFNFDHGRNGTAVIRAVDSLYRAYKGGVLEPMLMVMKDAWHGHESCARGAIMKGLILFLSCKEVKKKIDLQHLIESIQENPSGLPDYIHAKAIDKTRGSGRFINTVAQIIRDIYNNGLSGFARIKHDFVGDRQNQNS